MNMPTQVWGEVGKIGVSMAGATSAKAPLTALDSHKTLITMEGNGYSDAYREGSWGILTCNVGSGLYTSEHHGQESRQGRGILDGMFLPDRFLKEYYSDVRLIHFTNVLCLKLLTHNGFGSFVAVMTVTDVVYSKNTSLANVTLKTPRLI